MFFSLVVLCVPVTGCSIEPGLQRSHLGRNFSVLSMFNTEAEKSVYSVDDAQVTLSVRYGFRTGESPAGLHAEWIGPDGHLHPGQPIEQVAGTDMIRTSLRIRSGPGARTPGKWSVRLSRLGEQILERRFDIVLDSQPDNVGTDYRLPGDEMRREHW